MLGPRKRLGTLVWTSLNFQANSHENVLLRALHPLQRRDSSSISYRAEQKQELPLRILHPFGGKTGNKTERPETEETLLLPTDARGFPVVARYAC